MPRLLRSAPLALVLAVAAVLLLGGLGNRALWQDEAQTALLARSVLRHGVPLGVDPANGTSFSQEGGAELGPGGLYKWHPWLPFYGLAACFALFGTSDLVARLPFALAGWLTVALIHRLCRRRLGRPAREACIAAGLLALSVPFALLSRQCRYYAPLALLSLAGLEAWLEAVAEMADARRLVDASRSADPGGALADGEREGEGAREGEGEGEREREGESEVRGEGQGRSERRRDGASDGEAAGRGARLRLGVFATLLFHVHYLYAATLLASVLAHAALLDRAAIRRGTARTGGRVRLLRRLAPVIAGTTLVNLPWVVWLSTMRFGAAYAGRLFDPRRSLADGAGFLLHLARDVFPPPFLVTVAVVAALGAWRARHRRAPSPSLPLPLPVPLPGGRGAEGALLLGLFAGFTLVALSLTSPAPFFRYLAPLLPLACALLAPAVAAALDLHTAVAPALLALLVATSPLPDLAGEILHGVAGPTEALVAHLRAVARPSDTVVVTYGDLPLAWYTGLSVRGGLTGGALPLDADFIVLHAHPVAARDAAVAAALRAGVDWTRYVAVPLPAGDPRFESRECLPEHLFRAVAPPPAVTVYRRLPAR